MTGYGDLVVKVGEHVVTHHRVVEGGGVYQTVNDMEFKFLLQRAPLPSEFDIREMTTAQIAKALWERAEAEAAETSWSRDE